MLGFKWTTVVAWGVGAVIAGLAVWWVLQPLFAARAGRHAVEKVQAAVATVKVAESAKVKEKDDAAGVKVEVRRERVRVGSGAVERAPDPDLAWRQLLCGDELYAGSADCGGSGGTSGKH